MKSDIDIRSYRDFKRLIRNQTSKSMMAFYDSHYFTKHVGNKEIAASYFESRGMTSTKFTAIPLRIARIEPGHRILDIGCGRGELVFQSAHLGAEVIGIDYSESAIAIANATRELHDLVIQDRTTFKCVNAERLEFADNSFDRVFLIDVVEHVSQDELDIILQEAARVLKPDGTLVIHTPNIWTRTYGYWIKSVVFLLTQGKIPVHPVVAQFQSLKSDPDYDEFKILLHINEQSIISLENTLLKNGFKAHVWIENTGNRWIDRRDTVGRIFSFLYRLSGMKYFLGTELSAKASPKK